METTVEEKIESLNHVNKLRMWGIYQRELERQEQEMPIRAAYDSQYSRLGEITKINDWLSLAEHIEKGSKTTYFTALVDGKRTSTLFGDPISAILHGIGYKYDGINTRYHQFAVAMLPGLLKEIESNDNQ